MKILTVVGARPQFIKAAPVSRILRQNACTEIVVHTGQHYDHNMSEIFFEELQLLQPDVNLNIGSGSHGEQTGRMLAALEQVILEYLPDWVLVYGDTNSTLAGALAAVKLHIPVAHVEAGLRSFNREMPEEHNRTLTDHTADLLFCPTQTAVANLARESIVHGVHLTGDTMLDAVMQFASIAKAKSNILTRLEIQPKDYVLATVHRPYNTDDEIALTAIWQALCEIGKTVILPVHPRTRQKIDKWGMSHTSTSSLVQLIDPVGYLDMIVLEQNAAMILTDSGGVQKEAYFFAVPCVTLRPETEWVETVEAGWNVLVGADKAAILNAVSNHRWPICTPPTIFGDGKAASRIADLLTTAPRSSR